MNKVIHLPLVISETISMLEVFGLGVVDNSVYRDEIGDCGFDLAIDGTDFFVSLGSATVFVNDSEEFEACADNIVAEILRMLGS